MNDPDWIAKNRQRRSIDSAAKGRMVNTRVVGLEAGASPARSRHCDWPHSAESQTLSATKHVKRGRDIPRSST
jgi:hypothetical protein